MGVRYSIVVPVYNEAAVLPVLYRRVTDVMAGLDGPYEIVLVNDGSTDTSLASIKELRARDGRVKLVDLTRNFGHQIAITAGLDHASGDAVVIMDADLQDPPEVIPRLAAEWRAGSDVVYAVRERRRGEGIFKRATAAVFYRLLRRLTATNIPLDAGDFRLLSRRAADALRQVRERNRFVRGLVSWIGFRQTSVSYTRDARYAGETKYPLRKMALFAMDGIIAFSFVPLQLATYLGLAVSATSFIYIAYAMYLKVFTDRVVHGWTSLIVAVLFVGGVQLVSLGIIGEYIGRIFEEVKQRPLYLVNELAGFDQARETDARAAETARSRPDLTVTIA